VELEGSEEFWSEQKGNVVTFHSGPGGEQGQQRAEERWQVRGW
jgi:hypothetical protein